MDIEEDREPTFMEFIEHIHGDHIRISCEDASLDNAAIVYPKDIADGGRCGKCNMLEAIRLWEKTEDCPEKNRLKKLWGLL